MEGSTMRQAVFRMLCFAVALGLAGPASAQTPTPEDDLRRGLALLGEGAREMFEGLIDEIRPLLEGEVVPMLERLGALVDDLSHYQLPELLPNGDILIRRAPDAPPLEQAPDLPEIGEGGEVEI
jgi:hypothetical protein